MPIDPYSRVARGEPNQRELNINCALIIIILDTYLQRLDNGCIIVNRFTHDALAQPLAIKVVLGHAKGTLEPTRHEGLKVIIALLAGSMMRVVVSVVLAAH